jgi:hypothetical protein
MHLLRLPLCFLLLATAGAQNWPPGYTHDNSDWWSLTGRPESDEKIPDQNREPSAANFKILGLSLSSEDILKAAAAKLGAASVVQRGDASTGRSQACYASMEEQGRIHLIFEQGEVNEVLYLFEGGPDWKGRDQCLKSSLVTKSLSVASGLRLGLTPAEVKAILGKPSTATANELIYSFSVQEKSSAADLKRARQAYPGLSEEELQRNYGFYSLGVYIEARFASGKLTYLAISRLEVT